MSWDSTELDRVGTATELDLAARRTDETLSRFTTMWVVRVGDEPVRPLGLRTRQRLVPPCRSGYGRGRIRAGGVERDVVLDHLAPDDPLHNEIDAAFHAKYDRYGPAHRRHRRRTRRRRR